MRYFVDTEFIEDGKTIELISIGVVAEDGREYYAINSIADWGKANDWVRENVIKHILNTYGEKRPYTDPKTIASQLIDFIGQDKPEFWGYYCAYDWVVICQLFGTMMDLPKGWPMFMYDLRQWLNHKGLGEVSQPDDMPHHALSDARWIAETFKQNNGGFENV